MSGTRRAGGLASKGPCRLTLQGLTSNSSEEQMPSERNMGKGSPSPFA